MGSNEKRFSQFVKHHRKQFGYSQRELGEKIGLTRGTIMHIENGTQRIYLDHACRIAHAFNCKLQIVEGKMTKLESEKQWWRSHITGTVLDYEPSDTEKWDRMVDASWRSEALKLAEALEELNDILKVGRYIGSAKAKEFKKALASFNKWRGE